MNKKEISMEYCAPSVKEIELSNEGVICGSNGFGDANEAGDGMTPQSPIVL